MTGNAPNTADINKTPSLVHLDELPERTKQNVTFTGRCEALRKLGGLTFMRLAGHYFSLQVTILKPALCGAIIEIKKGDLVSVSGRLRARPNMPTNDQGRIDPDRYEIVLETISNITPLQQTDFAETEKQYIHQTSQTLSRIKHCLVQQDFMQVNAPPTTDFHEQQNLRQLISLKNDTPSSPPLFEPFTINQLMNGIQRFYFFIEGANRLPDILHIVIAHTESDKEENERLLTALTLKITNLFLPDIHWESSEPRACWQEILLHTEPSLRLTSHSNESGDLETAEGVNDGKRIASCRRLQARCRETSASIATGVSLPLNSLIETLELIKPYSPSKATPHDPQTEITTDTRGAYEAYCKLESKHLTLLVERSLRTFHSRYDLTTTKCSYRDALQYIEPALHHYGIDLTMAKRFLSLQDQLHPTNSETHCPANLFQLLWTVLGSPSAKVLLQDDAGLGRLQSGFIKQQVMTDIRQLVFIHPSAISALERLLEHKDFQNNLRSLLRSVIAKNPSELSTLLTTLAAMEPTRANAVITQPERINSAVGLGFTTPYWMSRYLSSDDTTMLTNELRFHHLESSQRLLSNTPVLHSSAQRHWIDGENVSIPLAETIYTLFRPATAGIRELENTLTGLYDHCAHLEHAGIRKFNRGFAFGLECYRYIIHQKQKEYDNLRIYISKNAASFFAKSTTGICTDINRDLFDRNDHFHLNLFSERLGRIVGNIQLYTISIKDESALLIRGLNPIKSYATTCLADEIINCVIACVTDIAIENGFSMVCVAEQNGLWNSNSNRPEIRAALALRLARHEAIALDPPLHLYNYYSTPVNLSYVYLL